MLVTKTGSKLWRYAYNFASKQKLLALGPYPVTSLADAHIKRDNAKKLLSEGIDPSVNRKEERRNARMARANTFEAVAKELMDKFEAEGNAPKTLKKKQWLLDFASTESASGRLKSLMPCGRSTCVKLGREAPVGSTPAEDDALARLLVRLPYFPSSKCLSRN
ncbi:Arm DNA-binding domain-containing protein [Bradyrhizobium archetypum]|nr:Arm DNA-binding domain-containing protein [Bradyrhizobium archetypum]